MHVSLENAFRIVFRDAFSNKVLNNRFCQDYCHLTYICWQYGKRCGKKVTMGEYIENKNLSVEI